MKMRDDGNLAVTAAELLSFKLCTGQCLLGLEGECQCRCQGRWHNDLASAEVIVPASLTLADALSGAGVLTSPRSPRPARVRRGKQRGPVTPERVRVFYAADIASGRMPSKRQIKRDWPVGYATASDLHAYLVATLTAT